MIHGSKWIELYDAISKFLIEVLQLKSQVFKKNRMMDSRLGTPDIVRC